MTNKEDNIVLVTGASGFIALHTIELLLEEGYRVRGTVRSLENSAKITPLLNLCPEDRYPLELVEADLTSDEGWADAVKDCKYVIHIASPFPSAPPENEDDLIVPAVEGTKRILQACADSGTVKRIVLTSSTRSIHGENTNEEGRVYCEEDWTDIESEDIDAYGKSKALAEKTAWDFIHDLPSSQTMELVTVNPSFVIGPSISGVVSSSLELIKKLVDGSMPLIPGLYLAICDVRDVAVAHLRAMILPEAANNRHILVSEHLWLSEIADILRNEFSEQNYSIPTESAPKSILWMYSFVDESVNLILPRVEQTYTFSNERMKAILKIEPRKLNDTLVDTVNRLVECGAINKD